MSKGEHQTFIYAVSMLISELTGIVCFGPKAAHSDTQSDDCERTVAFGFFVFVFWSV